MATETRSVYVVLLGYAYEGQEVLRVFWDRDEAIAYAAAEQRRDRLMRAEIEIEEWVEGADEAIDVPFLT